MKIETLDDWNRVNCCCFMPYGPAPTQECQSIQGSGQIGYVIYHSPSQTYYGRKRTDYEDGGFIQQRAPSTHWTQLGGQWIEPIQIESTDGDPKTGESEESLSDPVDVDASRNASFAAMAGALDWDNMSRIWECSAARSHPSPFGGFPAYHLHARFARFRWVIPGHFEGKYFKITWDVIDEPFGWNHDPPTAPRSFFARDLTWQWAGPGNPDNPDSWKSGWHEIPAPSLAGIRRVVNIRYESYRSAKFGTKPQVTGDAAEL